MAAFSDASFNTSAFSVFAFDFGAGPTPPAPDVITVRPSGGFPAYEFRRRTRKQIEEERRRFGIASPEAIITEIAVRQAERLERDSQKQLDELQGELKLRGIEMESAHIRAMNDARERLIDSEIKLRMQAVLQRSMDEARIKRQNKAVIELLMMMAKII